MWWLTHDVRLKGKSIFSGVKYAFAKASADKYFADIRIMAG
ncbi:MAG: hypothetical protein ACYS6W_11600 [Planctomycetota bacterium]